MPTKLKTTTARLRLLSVTETQEALGGIGRATLYGLVNAGDLRLVKIGRRSFLDEADVRAYVARLKAERPA